MNTINFINESLEGKVQTLEGQRGLLYKKYIRSSYDDNRLVFYPATRGPNMKLDCPVVRESNGTLFRRCENRLELLAVPPELTTSRYNIKFINMHIQHYNIYKMFNGTIVTLYWWPELNQWRMSSSKGFDVCEYKWNNAKNDSTYKEIFESLLELYDYATPQYFYDSLDRAQSYSFGFNHPDFHLFLEKKKPAGHIWFIQSFNTKSLKINYKPCVKNIPCQDIIFNGSVYLKKKERKWGQEK